MNAFLDLLWQRREELLYLLLEHIQMTSAAVLISICIGIPLGILVTKSKRASSLVIGLANIMQSIPSIGLLAFLVPFVGIGQRPAIIMVIIYALLPIIKNTYVGITGILPATLEAAAGIGLSRWRTLYKIQIPIAMPYIMAGVRISAVTAVGTVTIAAFAGAGGLGWLINLGLNANDPGLVLLGAIPACILALVVDFVLGKAENALTPEGLKPVSRIVNRTRREQRRRRGLAVCLLFVVLVVPCLFSVYGVFQKSEKKVVVGSENFTEALILGNIYSQLIQANTDLTVEEKFNLNGTMITMSAMERGDIDTFTDYTGVLISNVLKQEMTTDPQEVYDRVKAGMESQYQMQVSQSLGFSNTYVFAVTQDVAEKYNMTTISDMVEQSSSLRLGCTTAFTQREDLLPKLEADFGVRFKEVSGLEGYIRYQALTSGKVDVTDAFETDALLKKLELVKLEDDISFFPPYQAVSITREDTLAKYPQLQAVMDQMENAITTDEMMEMNYAVDVEGKTPKAAAIAFLKKKGMI